MFFKQAKRFPYYFACGIIAPRFHFGAHEFLQFGGKRYVHGLGSYFSHFSADNEDCQSLVLERLAVFIEPQKSTSYLAIN
jgi:hypothetical protein